MNGLLGAVADVGVALKANPEAGALKVDGLAGAELVFAGWPKAVLDPEAPKGKPETVDGAAGCPKPEAAPNVPGDSGDAVLSAGF